MPERCPKPCREPEISEFSLSRIPLFLKTRGGHIMCIRSFIIQKDMPSGQFPV